LSIYEYFKLLKIKEKIPKSLKDQWSWLYCFGTACSTIYFSNEINFVFSKKKNTVDDYI